MKNRNVGWLVIGIAVFIGLIIWIFNSGIVGILSATCSHGDTCTMYDSLKLQTWLSIAIALVVLFIGLFLVFSKEEKEIVIKKIKLSSDLRQKQFDKKSLKNLKLDKEEKQIMELLLENNGSIFQSKLVEETGLGKVRITRVLDSLEARGLIERRRRGMTNVIILKS